MKTLGLKIDIKDLSLGEADKTKTCAEIINAVIQNVILGYAQQVRGLDEKERRQYYKIYDILENAAKQNLEEVELDDEYIGFIRKCFRETKLVPNTLLKRIEDLINDIKYR